jgi:hypothetical protein
VVFGVARRFPRHDLRLRGPRPVVSAQTERFDGERRSRGLPSRVVFGATERNGDRAAISPRYATNCPL